VKQTYASPEEEALHEAEIFLYDLASAFAFYFNRASEISARLRAAREKKEGTR
jgi:hypothetical protein